MVPRPIAGDLADRIGRRPLVLLGTAIFMLAPVGYAVVGTIPGLLVVRLFHGTGMGFGPTAATVIATDLTPPTRRGAAMGVYGLASAVALAVGPYAGGRAGPSPRLRIDVPRGHRDRGRRPRARVDAAGDAPGGRTCPRAPAARRTG